MGCDSFREKVTMSDFVLWVDHEFHQKQLFREIFSKLSALKGEMLTCFTKFSAF